MNKTFTSLLLISTALAFVFTANAQTAQTRVDELDRYIEDARRTWDIPGISVAVVQDGKVLLSKGYGVRELGKPDKADNQTLFGAMSTTKAMTAVAMGLLVDEGKIKWDDNVVDHLPWFRVNDPYITSQLKVRDLFTHNAGMPNTDILWAWAFDYSADEILRRMQYVSPAYSFRSGFVYQNVMYVVAGKIIEKASGMTWERFMMERVFGPLGMKNTFATIRGGLNYQNRSSAHYKIDGKIEVITDTYADEIGPAGSAWSTSDDMAIWMNFLMNNHRVNGLPFISQPILNEIFRPQVMTTPAAYPTYSILKPNWTTYGLGWFQHDYRGLKADIHTGSLAGRTAIVGLLRDKKVGVYVFGNINQTQLRHALVYKVFDVFGFDDPKGRDWSVEFKKMYDELEANAEKQANTQLSANLKDTKPSRPLSAYAGRYRDDLVGEIEIRFANEKLRMMINGKPVGDLEHRQVDSFNVRWDQRWRGISIITFNLSPANGNVTGVQVAGRTMSRVS
ncbi:MAG TPA: serine hydrolase [Pyrinomonadaceae bacterium]|nr:serine hydrolase [Pyrinomonadaceae bacterium]